MSKKMANLSSSERKAFEREYQWLSNFPLWKMENVFVKETFERNQCMKNLCRSFYTSGAKLNRLDVAAHEAGHAIVMAATYGRVGEAAIDIEGHPEGLVGWVSPNHKHKDASDYQPIEQEAGMPCKPEIIRDILIHSAGFVGESLVGKKTGSNHEKFLIYCMCRHLDDLNAAKPLMNWAYYINWCRKIISNNEKLFWRVVDDLLATSKLSDSAKNLLHTSITKEPTELFF